MQPKHKTGFDSDTNKKENVFADDDERNGMRNRILVNIESYVHQHALHESPCWISSLDIFDVYRHFGFGYLNTRLNYDLMQHVYSELT